ncbi:MAG: hypothetical protein PHX79_06360 [Sphaerochaetaceae bacterium]|nr:hypothetical protein [Sphaerochaetaceae bacterium]
MKQIVKLKMSDSRDLIKIYNTSPPKGMEGGRIVDYEYTDTRGILRWSPPRLGVYSFVNENKPQYNKDSYMIINQNGAGLLLGKTIT